MKKEEKTLKNQKFRNAHSSLTHAKVYKQEKAITLIALIVTIIVNRAFYDKNKKYSNLVGSSL